MHSKTGSQKKKINNQVIKRKGRARAVARLERACPACTEPWVHPQHSRNALGGIGLPDLSLTAQHAWVPVHGTVPVGYEPGDSGVSYHGSCGYLRKGSLGLGLHSPPRHRGERMLPCRARPLPFCRQGLRPPPLTSALVLVLA